MYIYRRCIHVSSYNLSDVQEIYTRSLINKHYKSKTMDAFVVCVSFVEFMLHFFYLAPLQFALFTTGEI